jgi:transcriptional regulator with XRE-family HTH domain
MMEDLKTLIGEHIRTIRKFKGYTQESLAEQTGVSFSYISDVERGIRNISLISLEKIIHALHVTPYELFHLEQISNQPDVVEKRLYIDKIQSELTHRHQFDVKFIHKTAREFSRIMDH